MNIFYSFYCTAEPLNNGYILTMATSPQKPLFLTQSTHSLLWQQTHWSLLRQHLHKIMAKANQVHASCQTTSATIQQPVKINEVDTLFCYYFILKHMRLRWFCLAVLLINVYRYVFISIIKNKKCCTLSLENRILIMLQSCKISCSSHAINCLYYYPYLKGL